MTKSSPSLKSSLLDGTMFDAPGRQRGRQLNTETALALANEMAKTESRIAEIFAASGAKIATDTLAELFHLILVRHLQNKRMQEMADLGGAASN